jgi:hypothetical protein
MTARPRRVLPMALIIAALLAPHASAAAVWGPDHPVGPPSVWNPGGSLAATTHGLVAVWASDCPPPHGRCATDKGPYMGVFAQHGRGRWSKPVRLSQSKQQAERASVASSGASVVAGWVTQTSYRHYRPRAPRAFYVRRGSRAGAHWFPAVRLSPARGRVDYPTLAMTGATAYATWTTAGSGEIRLATSVNRGATWDVRAVGSTTARPDGAEGFAGYPAVGASGTNVAITWYADDGGKQVAKTSSVGGSDWTASSAFDVLTPDGPSDGFHYAGARGATDGASDDVAVTYSTTDGLAVRVWNGSTLGAERDVLAGPWPTSLRGRRYAGAYGPAVEPSGTQDLTLAFGACRATKLANPCNSTQPSARVDLFVSRSADGGATWTNPFRVSGKGATINESPSLVLTRPARIVVMWNARDARFLRYALRLRAGVDGP